MSGRHRDAAARAPDGHQSHQTASPLAGKRWFMMIAVTTGYLLAAAAMTALGSSVAASTLLVDYPVFTGQAIRYGLAAVILVALFRGRLRRPDLPELLQLAALAAIGLAGFNVLLIASLRGADTLITPLRLAGALVVCGGVILGVSRSRSRQ